MPCVVVSELGAFFTWRCGERRLPEIDRRLPEKRYAASRRLRKEHFAGRTPSDPIEASEAARASAA
jgi:hypothetical protein